MTKIGKPTIGADRTISQSAKEAATTASKNIKTWVPGAADTAAPADSAAQAVSDKAKPAGQSADCKSG